MKKYAILGVVLAVVVGFVFRIQVNNFGKKAYFMGCMEASQKLALVGDLANSVEIERFCKARQKMMDKHLGIP